MGELLISNVLIEGNKVASVKLEEPFATWQNETKTMMVGVRGLEPPTPRSQSAYSSQLSYTPTDRILF